MGPCQLPDLHRADHCCSLILVNKKTNDTCPTSTQRRLVHGAMYGVWRKTHIPHRNRHAETLQTQKAAAPSRRLVVCRKPPQPHKEKKKKIGLLVKQEGQRQQLKKKRTHRKIIICKIRKGRFAEKQQKVRVLFGLAAPVAVFRQDF